MKTLAQTAVACLLTLCIAGLARSQQPLTQSAYLAPSAPTATNTFTLEPQQTGNYNVTIQSGAPTYSVQVSSPVMNPAADPDNLWIWRQTGGGANSFTFEVVNTIWEERSVTVTVNCVWVPVSAAGGDSGGGVAPETIQGEAKGIALHKWGQLVATSDIAIEGAPEYLCINETITLRSWLVTNDFPFVNPVPITSDWEVEPIGENGGDGQFQPTTGNEVLFIPTSPGHVRVTATESQYGVNSGTVEFIIVKAEITTEDEPGNLICVGGTKEYTAVITPTNVANVGEFSWIVSDANRLGIVGATNNSSVTVTGKVASASVNDEELTVQFSINNELICAPSTNLTVVQLKINETTSWLVIEDEQSPGAGPDMEGEQVPMQKAENEARILYDILPAGVTLENVELTIENTDFSMTLPAVAGAGQEALIKTKDGKLNAGDDENPVWYPEEGLFPAGSGYVIRLTVEYADTVVCYSETNMTIRPLLENLVFTPDVSEGESFCPYSDPFIVSPPESGGSSACSECRDNDCNVSQETREGYGLQWSYNLLHNLSDLTVTVEGGDIDGVKSFDVEEGSLLEGVDYHAKWEGWDNDVSEFIEAYNIVNFCDEMGPRVAAELNEKAPMQIVREGDDYLLKIELTHEQYEEQSQSFVIPVKVEYKLGN